jgi:hypothetical protein
MRTKSLILAGLALAALVSCSKENKENPVFSGDKAYINVNIAYSDAATRGTGDAINPFYFGTASEYDVLSAHFFFYNADGTFAAYASKAKSEMKFTANGTDEATKNNIESVASGVVVLEGLKSTNYPSYMAVVLNPSTGMVDALKNKSISQAQAYIINAIATEGTSTTWSNFVMTSSTYDNDDAATGYFCEKLQPNNFQEVEDEAVKDANTVTAYVERLAAKVKLGLGDEISNAKGKIGSFSVDGKATDLYFSITGWGLDATAKSSYTFKNINPRWSFNGFTWNDETNHRSYWAEFPEYGVNDNTVYYPKDYNSVVSSKKTPTLNYVSYNDLAVALNGAAYCRENTNTEAVLKAVNFSGAVTSVLLQAKVTDASGNAIQLVNYGKKLYTYDEYVKKALADYAENHPNDLIFVGPATPDATSVYTQISTENVESQNAYDGDITLKAKALDSDKSYYLQSGNTYEAKTAAEVTEYLIENNGTLAEYYKDGMMYYNIPIEHLNNGAKYTASDFVTNMKEATYGVVRNHYYMITVTGISNLGKAVYEAEEDIVPSDDDIKNYYVGAKVNILSWKVVKQSVEL